MPINVNKVQNLATQVNGAFRDLIKELLAQIETSRVVDNVRPADNPNVEELVYETDALSRVYANYREEIVRVNNALDNLLKY